MSLIERLRSDAAANVIMIDAKLESKFAALNQSTSSCTAGDERDMGTEENEI